MEGMRLVRTAETPLGRPPLAAFCALRNERKILPDLLRHHRQLGIREFYFVDNDSTDGSLEWLAAQTDVTLFHTNERFSEARCGTNWINALIREFGIGRWCLYVDADEHFVYRDCESVHIDDYVRKLDDAGATGVFGFMLDCYPNGPLSSAEVTDDARLRDVCPLFDGDYVFRQHPRKPWAPDGFPTIEVLGGPRLRLWGSLKSEARTTWFRYFLRGQVDRIVDHVPDRLFPLYVRYLERQPPALQKMPLVKPESSSFEYINNAHECVPLKMAAETAVLLHYKFTSDFYRRVVHEASRGEHYRRGAQYLRYVQLFAKRPALSLSYTGSKPFRSSNSLAERDLFRGVDTIR